MRENITTDEQIRLRLCQAIEASGMTMTAIAKMVGITVATISDYKNKGKLPSLVTFRAICKAIDISSDEILGLN
jgi:transcriptional regulator with XRE-family HTH domain